MELPGREFISIDIGEHIRKIDEAGKAWCTLCSDSIKYGSSGCKALTAHLLTPKHKEHLITIYTNRRLFPQTTSSTYGLEPNLVDNGIHREELTPLPPTFAERKFMAEAMVLGLTAEHALPLNMPAEMIKLAQALASDPKVLYELSMERTSATYKLKYGISKTFHDRTIENLKTSFFSLNIDESFSSNNMKVLTLLVCYFSDSVNQVVVEHLESVSLYKVDSLTVYGEIVRIFNENDIPWDNLCSILMDSCGVMRGSKNGVETRIRRDVAPHLLDIDGDVCHHLHNATKRVCTPFQNYIEIFFTDLHTHFKFSPDLRFYFKNICYTLGLVFTTPDRFLSHRWLSVYDVSVSTLRLFNTYFVFFYSYLSEHDQNTFNDLLEEIYANHYVTDADKLEILGLQKKIRSKKMGTKVGQERQKRIIKYLTDDILKTKLVLQFYSYALSPLKRKVCLFQSKVTLVHILNDEQLLVFKAFLCRYFKSEYIKPMNPTRLKNFNMDDDRYHLSEIIWGDGTKSLMKQLGKNYPVLDWFKKAGKTGLIEGAKYLQKKVPLDNPLLMALSGLDPVLQSSSHHQIQKPLASLPKSLTNVLLPEEKVLYETQILNYMVDPSLPVYMPPTKIDKDETSGKSNSKALEKSNDPNVYSRADEWWAAVKKTGRYNQLTKVAFAALSCFHGPLVESSFNSIGNIMDSKRSNMCMDTYNAYMNIQYYLRSHNTNALCLFSRKDPIKDAIDSKLCLNMRNSSAMSKAVELENKAKKRPNLQTKKAFKDKLRKDREDELKAQHRKKVQKEKGKMPH